MSDTKKQEASTYKCPNCEKLFEIDRDTHGSDYFNCDKCQAPISLNLDRLDPPEGETTTNKHE